MMIWNKDPAYVKEQRYSIQYHRKCIIITINNCNNIIQQYCISVLLNRNNIYKINQYGIRISHNFKHQRTCELIGTHPYRAAYIYMYVYHIHT